MYVLYIHTERKRKRLEPNSVPSTFEVGKAAVLFDDGRLSGQAAVLAAHAAADVGVLLQFRPHRAAVGHKVQLVEQGRLVPGGERTTGSI